MKFKKFNSIENTYRQKTIEHIIALGFDSLDYVVQEKVHGANFSFITDGKEIRIAKRSGWVEAGEGFYGAEKLLEKYKERVLALFKGIACQFEKVKQVTVYGELYGGSYPHPEVERNPEATKIQKGILYNPENDFYAFDIVVNETILPVDVANELLEAYGFFYAKTLFRGSLKEALEYPNEFQTKLPEWLGLPAIEDNVCEGVIIRPVEPKFFGSGSRVILKNKNEKWSERVKKDKTSKPVALPEEVEAVWLLMEQYINENRLQNVASKLGEFEPKRMGEFIKELSTDTLKDFLADENDAWNTVEEEYQKRLRKMMNKSVVRLLKQEYMQLK